MRVHVIHPGDLGPSEIDAWHRMQKATASQGDPFLSPEYAIAVGRFRPQSRVAVLVDGQCTVGFFPFEARRLGAGVPISGWLSACQGVVHEPGVRWDMGELLRGCNLSAWRFDNLIVDQVAAASCRADIAPAPVIDLTAGFDSYYAQLRERSPRFCREIERKARKIAREAGELRLASDSPDPDLLNLMIAWKSAQYRDTDAVDRFAVPWVTGLLHATLAMRGDHLSGLLSVLYAGDQPVSMQFGLRSGGILEGWFTVYDQRFSKYSPGLLHLKLMTGVLRGHGIDRLHMGKGAKPSARAFKSYDTQLGTGTATGRSALGLVHRAADGVGRQAVGTVRGHQALRRAADQVLRRSGASRRLYGKL